ncbi:F-box-like domain protein [Rhizoctonia solani AG-3 Rhs1AP]|uniref:F-box-like domain protein n=1 Tax=Rhizoctonia solani AG-3 Rhs1AP TaxID=1086054 RepID=X8J4K9_9AGAM|nr:F-box-like domain protein [Rhizoctonia solani AG-3 Rhs1AP]
MNPLAPISIENLPAELLARIFRFAHDGEHCLAPDPDLISRDGPHRWLKFPKQPDTLSHVCSTWRRIALNTSYLWSHIDIAIDDSSNNNLFARAKVYAQRSGSRALEIHICDPGSERERQKWLARQYDIIPGEYTDLHEFKFLDANVVPIRSLILDVCVFNHLRRAHYSALEYFLTKCATGELTHYIVRANVSRSTPFVETTGNPQTPQGGRINLLQLPRSQLEERWRFVNVLHVNSLCPRWSSKLYHGLVDLRLGDKIPEITELQLVKILEASPGLRILHLKNQITLQIPEGTTVITKVQLNDLEVLNIEDMEYDFDNGAIVRWIQPGVKPLRFTFFGMPTTIVAEFFKRSNVTRFYSRGWEPFTLIELLRVAPRLQTLVLNAFDLEVDTIGSLVDPIDEKRSIAPTPVYINTLYLLGFYKLELSDIQEAVNRYSIQRVSLWACDLAYTSSTGVEIYEDATVIREKLSEITNCPIVEYLTGDNPIDLDTWE